MRNAVDFVSAPDPAELARLELDALVYTGNARPSQAWVDQARALGVTVTFIMETTSTRSQQGFQAGRLDCQFAETRAKERGHTGSIAVVVSDGNGADNWDASEYGRGWASVATLPFFAYGAVPICESFARGAHGLCLGSWVPETWGHGTLMSQQVGASPIPNTDLNIVHADYTIPIPVGIPARDEDGMYFVQDPDGSGRIWQVGDTRRALEGDEWAFRTGPYGGNPYSNPPGGPFHALTISQAWFDNIPVLGTSGEAVPVGALHVELAGTATPA